MSYVALTRGFFEIDKFSLSKLKIQHNLQGNLITRNNIQVKGSYSIQLKNGTDLINYNNKMYDIIRDLILYNKQSDGFVVLSLLCFGVFFSLIINSTLPIYLFMAIFLFVLVLFIWEHDKRKKIK